MKIKIGNITKIKTGKLDANAATENGKYQFFTCSQHPLKISTYSYDCECILVSGNGDFNVKYYNGKFDAYQRTYIIENRDTHLLYMPYLYYFLSKYVDKLRNQAIGGVIKYIKLGNLTDAIIDLPNMDTQMKIAHKLDVLERILKLKKQQILTFDMLLKARFVEMFGKCNNKMSIDDICSMITDGTHQAPKFQRSGIPFIFVSNLANNRVTYCTEKFISDVTYNVLIKRTPIEVGDVLLTTVGSYGHPAVVVEDKKFLFQRHIAYLKPDHNIVNSFFLHSALLTSEVQRQIEDKVKGIAQKTLNLSEIRKIIIPIPNIKLQDEFANFVHQVDKSKSSNTMMKNKKYTNLSA